MATVSLFIATALLIALKSKLGKLEVDLLAIPNN
jgi:hypothetical protein